jgi:hypothetical protein
MYMQLYFTADLVNALETVSDEVAKGELTSNNLHIGFCYCT